MRKRISRKSFFISILCIVLTILITSCGGGGGGDTANIDAPTITSFDSSTATITAGESVDLTAVFTNGTGSIDNGVGTVSSNVAKSVSPDSTTTYTLTATNGAGTFVTSTVAVNVVPAPTITSFDSSAATITAGESVDLTAVFTNGTGSIDNGAGTVSSNVAKSVSPDSTTTYTLTATNGAGTFVTSTVAVNVVPAPTITSFDSSAATITAGKSVDLTAVFTNGTGSIDNGAGTVSSNVAKSVSPDSTTTYTLTATNGAGTFVTSTVAVNVVPAPTITSFDSSAATITAGESVDLTAVFANGTGSIDNGAGTVSSNVAKSVSPASTTTYTLTVNNSLGSTVNSAVTVTVVPAPTVTGFVSSAATISAGDSVFLTALFSNGTAGIDNGVGTVDSGIAKSVTPASTTTYILTVTNGAGSTVGSAVTVTVVPVPTITSFDTSSSTITAGDSVDLTAIFTDGTGSIDNGVGTVDSGIVKSVTPEATTTYTLTVTNGAGNTVTATVTVTVEEIVHVGKFIDSPVANIGYRTPTRTGYTNSEGEFEYVEGEEVVFSVGNVEFPASIAETFVTPLGLARTDAVHDDTVINVCRLLQSLDEDGIPENGIKIPAAAEAAASSPILFEVSEEEFTTIPEVINLVANSGSVNNTLKHRDDAALHCARHLGVDFAAGPFTAEYYNNDTFVASETVDRPAINYPYDYFQGIDSYDFHAVWTGNLQVWFKPKVVDISFDVSWSDVSLFIDGQEVETWSNSTKVIQYEFSVGVHEIRIEYHNNWHTTGFNVNFTDKTTYTMDQARDLIMARIDNDTQIIYVGTYDSEDYYNKIVVTLDNITEGKVFLFISSYDAINWVIENPNDVKIMGVAYSSYDPKPVVAVGRSTPTFELENFGYARYPEDLAVPYSNIQYMTGRRPDYGVPVSDVTQVSVPGPPFVETPFGGDLDSNAIPDGFAVHNGAAGGNSDDSGQSVTLDSTGNVYVTGYSKNVAGDYDMAIWRYTDSGSLDTTFGGDINADGVPDGFVVHDNAAGGTSSDDGGLSITLDNSDRIYVTGYSASSTGEDMVIWRYTGSGSLDTTFGGDLNTDGIPDGFVVQNGAAGGDSNDRGNSIILDGSLIYVAGESTNIDGNKDMVVWRYISSGSLDTTFGGDRNSDGIPDGFAVHNGAAGGSGHDAGYAITKEAYYYSYFYVTGYSARSDTDDDMVIWRYTTSGILDTTFAGGAGYVVYHNDTETDINEYGKSIVVYQSQIYVAGYIGNTSTDYDMAIWQYQPNTGNLDPFFGQGGLVVHNNAAGGNSYDFGESISIGANGAVYVGGYSKNAAGNYDMVIWRYTSGGNLNTIFGDDLNYDGTPDGFAVLNGAAGGSDDDRSYSIALDTAGQVYSTGSSLNSAGDQDVVVWRYEHPLAW